MKFDDFCNLILERAFHGTPHDIVGNFDLNKIGSGEGAQVYGWGLYFAENPEVAKIYSRQLSPIKILNKEGNEISDDDLPKTMVSKATLRINIANAFANTGGDPIEMVKNFREHSHLKLAEFIENLYSSGGHIESQGHVYAVDIDVDKENDFLDWDKPMSQQSPKIQNKLKSINLADRYDIGKSAGSLQYGFYTKDNGYLDTDKPLFRKEEDAVNFLNNPKGETIYSEIDYEPKKASQFLLKKGIKGIKYLDQDSRGTGEGTYNYVVFDPSIIKIVAKNGEFVMNSKKPENVEI